MWIVMVLKPVGIGAPTSCIMWIRKNISQKIVLITHPVLCLTTSDQPRTPSWYG